MGEAKNTGKNTKPVKKPAVKKVPAQSKQTAAAGNKPPAKAPAKPPAKAPAKQPAKPPVQAYQAQPRAQAVAGNTASGNNSRFAFIHTKAFMRAAIAVCIILILTAVFLGGFFAGRAGRAPSSNENGGGNGNGETPGNGGDEDFEWGGNVGGDGSGIGVFVDPNHNWVNSGHPTITIPADFWTRNGFFNPFDISAFTPDAVEASVRRIFPEQTFNELFPNRMGMGEWFPSAAIQATRPPDQVRADYYSYANFIAAVRFLADIVVITEMRVPASPANAQPHGFTQQVTVIHRSNQTQGTVIRVGENFNVSWNLGLRIHAQVITFGNFINDRNGTDRLHAARELSAFLANLTQETSGGTAGQPDRLTRGLWWNEEIGFEGGTTASYIQNGHYFPPMNHPTGRQNSYHGRGGIQLSWNFNYGLFSGIFFNDARILLERPELIIFGGNVRTATGDRHMEGGMFGWMTAIGFWMMPQQNTPSCHQVMRGYWRASQHDINRGRHTGVDEGHGNGQLGGRARPGDYHSIGFAMTIMIINGGLEGGFDTNDPRIHTRAHMYLRVADFLQRATGIGVHDAAITEKLNTLRLGSFP